MSHLYRIWFIPLLLLIVPLCVAQAAEGEEDFWAPTPPRLSFIEGEVSYTREGTDEWVRARLNLALAEGDTLYTGRGDNFEVQFGSRNFARAAENSQLTLLALEEHYIQFKVPRGLVSFDVRSMRAGDTLEVSTPNAVFTIEQPGYYRVEVGPKDTHFITYHGGRAIVTTADGRSMSIYPSEDIVVRSGYPIEVVAYAAPDPDDWDLWNDTRSEHIGKSISARYLPPDVYGAEDLDHHGFWRVVPDYGQVWIPHRVAPGWVPYSTGSWLWDPYYEWTWIDDAPWGWAPFHYGRWVYIGNYWAWAPGPMVRRSVYYPALVAFLIHDHDVSVRIRVGLPGLWWVALSWGEPVLPWWGHHRHRWHPRWDGWGGPRIVNGRAVGKTATIKAEEIHFHNARIPRAIMTMPVDKFGRERFRVMAETRYRHEDFVPLRDEFPVKPVRENLLGGALRGVRPPSEMVAQPVVSTRPPRERKLPWKDDGAGGIRIQDKPSPRQDEIPKLGKAAPELRIVKPPVRRDEDRHALPRPPAGREVGPERRPPPLPPSFQDVVKARKTQPSGITLPQQPSGSPARPPTVGPTPRKQPSGITLPQKNSGGGGSAQSLPGNPANQTFGGTGK